MPYFGRATFLRDCLLQELKSPWELILTEPVPEVFEFRPADWPEKYFSSQSARKFQLGKSVTFLHEVIFFIDRPAWPVQREGFSWRVSEIEKKKDVTKPRKSQAVTCRLGSNTIFSRRIYQRHILNFYS